ncbi:hypothetical protein PFISCL1PPCAC_17601, partial [Pristionchus fissidentatus]
NSNAAEKRDRMLRPKHEIEAEVKRGINAAAYKENVADTYYPGRSADLEDFSLLNIVTRFTVKVIKRDGARVGGEQGDDEENEDDEDNFARTANSRNTDPFEPHFSIHCSRPPWSSARTPLLLANTRGKQ